MDATLPARVADSHKGTYGRILVIAGSAGMLGSGSLSSRAALRSGSGLVTWALPLSLSITASLSVPELIILPVPETAQKALSVDAREHLLEAAMEVDAVILGPGLPVAGESGELMRLLISEINAPLIIDAGALRAIGTDLRPVKRRKSATIMTPHPGEMAGLCGKTVEDISSDRAGVARDLAQQSEAIVVLKGHASIVDNGTEAYINQTGNSGMSTAGSGDVLCGVIASLIGQGMEAYQAAVLGTHLHGIAGDLAAADKGEYGMIAGDVIENLPYAFKAYAAKV